ncbi:MAG: type II toxin-antitoxin system HicA family toxin [Verrucomicrobia bacterium]|nr:type II toxin-antitoxin system HicA family toxin [Verrucomicrobiota bacterium]
MTRLPTLNARQVVQALKRAGFVEQHQRGSHLYFSHLTNGRVTTVPIHPGDLSRRLVRQIIQQAGLSEKELSALL